MKTSIIGMLVFNAIAASATGADDWPHFFGPRRDGFSLSTGINKDWNAIPPAILWRVSLTDDGFSGPSVAAGKVFILDYADRQALVRALDLETGREIWRYAYEDTQRGNHGYTRSTPSYADGRVFVTGRLGEVLCLDAETGALIWKVNVVQTFGGRLPTWQMSGSPLVVGERVIVTAGGDNALVVALDAKTGSTIWQGGGSDVPGYSTPLPTTLSERPALLVYNAKGMVAVSPDDGTIMNFIPWPTRHDVNAPTPIPLGNDRVWLSSGYGTGSAAFQLIGRESRELWRSPKVSPHWSSAILYDGHLYITTPNTDLVCIDIANGAEKWRSSGTGRGFEHGGLCAVDGTLIVVEGQTGAVVQVELTPEAYRELGRINPLNTGKCWVAPIVARGRLLVRSSNELVCLDLRLQEQ